MMKCAGCGHDLRELWDLGLQPVSFQFANKADRVSLKLCQCEVCGLLQLEQSLDEATLATMPSWIEYKEPEAHLAELSDFCNREISINRQTRVRVLSSHDLPLLEFLELGPTSVMDPPPTDRRPNPWLVEQGLDMWVAEKNPCDLVIARRMLEHFENPGAVLDKLRKLGCSNLLLEVPDSTKSLAQGDVTMIWEEHKSYFTPDTLKNTLAAHGWEVTAERIWPDAQEDILVVIATPTTTVNLQPTADHEQSMGDHFVHLAAQHQSHIESALAQSPENAILGVGHRSSAFVHYHRLQAYVFAAHDDNEHKTGQYFPGTRTTIVPTHELDANTHLCLLAMSPSGARKVYERLSPNYQITKFASILPDSPLFGFI